MTDHAEEERKSDVSQRALDCAIEVDNAIFGAADERIAAAVADQTAALRQQLETKEVIIKASCAELESISSQLAERERQVGAMREALEELVATVRGECPSLLNEDSGGDANLDMRIKAALASPAPPLDGEKPSMGDALKLLERLIKVLRPYVESPDVKASISAIRKFRRSALSDAEV